MGLTPIIRATIDEAKKIMQRGDFTAISGTLQQATTSLETVSVTLQQTTTSVAGLQSQLCAVNSSLRDIDSTLNKNTARSSSCAELSVVVPTKDSLDSSASLQLGQSQTQPLSVNQMVAELHRCLILGESPTGAVNSSFQNAAGREKAQVVSSLVPVVGLCRRILSLRTQLATTASRLVQYPEDLRSSLQNRRDINPAPHSVGAILTSRGPSCRCPKSGSPPKQRQAGIGPFRYMFSSRERHLYGCPFYLEADCEKTHSLALPILPLLAGTVELFSTVCTRQRLTSFSVKYYPTTHRASSPAFALLHGAFGKLKYQVRVLYGTRGGFHIFRDEIGFPKDLPLLMQEIPAKLEALFSSGAALPSEKDEFGHTLLFVSEAKLIFDKLPQLTTSQELLLLCQFVSGTSAWSHAFIPLINNIAARLIDSGVDLNASTSFFNRCSPGLMVVGRKWGTSSAADLAFCALATQSTPCNALNPDFSLYHTLISRTGLTMDMGKMALISFCAADFLRLKSTLLDLLRSPYQHDLCE